MRALILNHVKDDRSSGLLIKTRDGADNSRPLLSGAGTVSSVEPTEIPRSDGYEALPAKHVTIDQVVASNMRRWRKAAGMTQKELGDLLGWSDANVSALEQSVAEDRDRRRFDAQAIAAIAVALELPLSALFLPPEDDGDGKRYLFGATEKYGELQMADLMLLVMPGSVARSPQFDLYRDRFERSASLYLDEEAGKEVARWMRHLEGKEARAERAQRLRSRRAALLDTAAELEDLADALEVDLDDEEES